MPYIDDIDVTTPAAGAKLRTAVAKLQGLQQIILDSFPYITGSVNASHTELNRVVGLTASVSAQMAALTLDKLVYEARGRTYVFQGAGTTMPVVSPGFSYVGEEYYQRYDLYYVAIPTDVYDSREGNQWYGLQIISSDINAVPRISNRSRTSFRFNFRHATTDALIAPAAFYVLMKADG